MERLGFRIVRFTLAIGLSCGLLGTAGCRTEFYGSPRFPGGARACFDKCAELNMEMATFVYVGEYSTACACRPKASGGTASSQDGSQGAIVAAAAGVDMQSRRDAEAQAQQQGAAPVLFVP